MFPNHIQRNQCGKRVVSMNRLTDICHFTQPPRVNACGRGMAAAPSSIVTIADVMIGKSFTATPARHLRCGGGEGRGSLACGARYVSLTDFPARLASADRAPFWSARGRPCRYQPAPLQPRCRQHVRTSLTSRLRGVLFRCGGQDFLDEARDRHRGDEPAPLLVIANTRLARDSFTNSSRRISSRHRRPGSWHGDGADRADISLPRTELCAETMPRLPFEFVCAT